MFIKQISYASGMALVICCSNVTLSLLIARDIEAKTNHLVRRIQTQNEHNCDTDIPAATLRIDTPALKKYVMEKVANDIKKAKKWGKGMAKAFGGISGYAFDAIPFEFFTDNSSIEQAFKRLEEGADYIAGCKETFKKTMTAHKRKINESKLAEFLYLQLVGKINVTDEQRAILAKEPLKMDEFVRKGIVNRSEYMYYTLLNFAVRYYLEQELKNK